MRGIERKKLTKEGKLLIETFELVDLPVKVITGQIGGRPIVANTEELNEMGNMLRQVLTRKGWIETRGADNG